MTVSELHAREVEVFTLRSATLGAGFFLYPKVSDAFTPASPRAVSE